MKRIVVDYLLILFVILLSVERIFAQINYAGFVSAHYQQHNSSDHSCNARNGEFELHLSNNHLYRFFIESGLVFDTELNRFSLGRVVIDFDLLDGNRQLLSRGGILKNIEFRFGQFEVPFGIDYFYYEAPNRKLVSQPLVYEETIGCWNQIAGNINLDFKFVNLTSFIANGFDGQPWFGFKSSLLPLNSVDFGFSYASRTKNSFTTKPKLFGLHVRVNLPFVHFRSEYIVATHFLDEVAYSKKRSGFYFQMNNDYKQLLNLPLFSVFRIGRSKIIGYNLTEREVNRITVGLGATINNHFEIRLEHINEKLPSHFERSLTLQSVLLF